MPEICYVFLCDARRHHPGAAPPQGAPDPPCRWLIVVGRQTDPRPSLGHDIPVPVMHPVGLPWTCRSRPTTCWPAGWPSSTSSRAAAPASPTSRRARVRRGARRGRRRPAALHDACTSSSSATSCTASGRSAATPPRCSWPSTRTSTRRAGPTRSPAVRHGARPAARRARRRRGHGVRQLGGADDERPPGADQHRRQPAAPRRMRRSAFAALDSGEVGSGTEYVAGRLVIRGSHRRAPLTAM